MASRRHSSRRGKDRRRFTFRSFLGRLVLFGAALLQVLCYASMYVNPAEFWPAAMLTVAAFAVALVNVAVLILALVGRSRVFWVPLLVLVPALFLAEKVVSFSELRPVGGEGSVDMVSYNVGRFSLPQGEDPGKEQLTEHLFSQIREYDPDIICLQEYWSPSIEEMDRQMAEYFSGYQYKYYLHKDWDGYSGNVTISRFPVTSAGVEHFEGSSNLAIYSDIVLGGRMIRLYNCHFQSYSISATRLVKLVNNMDDYALETGRRVVGAIRKRPRQVGQVLENVKQSPYDAIICGDFNDTPMSYTYTSLLSGRKDTFVEAGSGFGGSYSKLWPMLRIDYIFVPEDFEVTGHITPKLPFSDHYPVLTSFRTDENTI